MVASMRAVLCVCVLAALVAVAAGVKSHDVYSPDLVVAPVLDAKAKLADAMEHSENVKMLVSAIGFVRSMTLREAQAAYVKKHNENVEAYKKRVAEQAAVEEATLAKAYEEEAAAFEEKWAMFDLSQGEAIASVLKHCEAGWANYLKTKVLGDLKKLSGFKKGFEGDDAYAKRHLTMAMKAKGLATVDDTLLKWVVKYCVNGNKWTGTALPEPPVPDLEQRRTDAMAKALEQLAAENVGEFTPPAELRTRTVIVGGGPAGLGAAVMAYAAGADEVHVVEKRSAYTRHNQLSQVNLGGIATSADGGAVAKLLQPFDNAVLAHNWRTLLGKEDASGRVAREALAEIEKSGHTKATATAVLQAQERKEEEKVLEGLYDMLSTVNLADDKFANDRKEIYKVKQLKFGPSAGKFVHEFLYAEASTVSINSLEVVLQAFVLRLDANVVKWHTKEFLGVCPGGVGDTLSSYALLDAPGAVRGTHKCTEYAIAKEAPHTVTKTSSTTAHKVVALPVDVLVGADGLKSEVRKEAFADKVIAYTARGSNVAPAAGKCYLSMVFGQVQKVPAQEDIFRGTRKNLQKAHKESVFNDYVHLWERKVPAVIDSAQPTYAAKYGMFGPDRAEANPTGASALGHSESAVSVFAGPQVIFRDNPDQKVLHIVVGIDCAQRTPLATMLKGNANGHGEAFVEGLLGHLGDASLTYAQLLKKKPHRGGNAEVEVAAYRVPIVRAAKAVTTYGQAHVPVLLVGDAAMSSHFVSGAGIITMYRRSTSLFHTLESLKKTPIAARAEKKDDWARSYANSLDPAQYPHMMDSVWETLCEYVGFANEWPSTTTKACREASNQASKITASELAFSELEA